MGMPVMGNRSDTLPTPEIFALCLVAAAGLQVMENILPRFPLFPWMRLGLSYVIILPFLLRYGVRPALALLLARNGMTLLFGGQPLSTFLIGTGAGLASFLVLGGAIRWAYSRRLMGLVGAGVLLASGFNLAQLALVKWTLVRHSGFFVQSGPLLAWSLASGTAVALLIRLSAGEIGQFLSDAGMTAPETGEESRSGKTRPGELPEGRPAYALAAIMAMATLLITDSPSIQATGFLMFAAISGRDGARTLRQAWPFFFFLAWLHLLRTPGTMLPGGWTTREGLHAFILHGLRLGNLILAGKLASSNIPWRWLGRRESIYIRGFTLALPLMPTLFPRSIALGKEILGDLKAGRRENLLAKPLRAWRLEMSDGEVPPTRPTSRPAKAKRKVSGRYHSFSVTTRCDSLTLPVKSTE